LHHGVFDTQVVVLANAQLTRHVSAAQRARYQALRLVVEGRVVPVRSDQLDHEYVVKLRKQELSDLLREFIRALDGRGRRNYQPLSHSEIASLRQCGFPLHDDHLVRTAKGVEDAAIVTEESALLAASSCVAKKLGTPVLSPPQAVALWA
jgi:hypothetical protein